MMAGDIENKWLKSIFFNRKCQITIPNLNEKNEMKSFGNKCEFDVLKKGFEILAGPQPAFRTLVSRPVAITLQNYQRILIN